MKSAKELAPPKPDGVQILSTNTVAVPLEGGNITLFIIGLGDDGLMYAYDGAAKLWRDQK